MVVEPQVLPNARQKKITNMKRKKNHACQKIRNGQVENEQI
jgi:hypothetical protein